MCLTCLLELRLKNMQKRVTEIRPLSQLRRFQRSEEGTFTLEAVIWMPIFAILLAIIMNLSMVFYYESQMLRIVQDATRAYSLGKFDDPDDGKTPEQATEDHIRARLAFLNADLTIDTNPVNAGDWFYGQTVVSTTAKELMPFELMSGPFAGIPIGVSTQFIMEF